MARTLIDNAFADSRVRKVIAHTTDDNVASSRVLEKCGFVCVRTNEEFGNKRFEILRASW